MTMSRDFTTINGRQIRHDVATKNYVCGECESPLVTVFDREWMTVCSKNRKHTYFITKYSLAQRISNEMQQAENLTIADRRLGMGLKDRDDEYGQPTRMRLGRVGRIRQGVMVPNKKGDIPLSCTLALWSNLLMVAGPASISALLAVRLWRHG